MVCPPGSRLDFWCGLVGGARGQGFCRLGLRPGKRQDTVADFMSGFGDVMSVASEQVRGWALEAGFDAVGIVPIEPMPRAEHFRLWLKKGYHGSMAWIARDPERRCDPGLVMRKARSAIVVGVSYQVEDPPPALWDDPLRGRIARYAWGRDYHKVLPPRLKRLAERLGGSSRVYVDTGPILERELAERAGIGFIGKNTLVLSPSFGSYLLLGVLLTSEALELDGRSEAKGTCGACTRCQTLCPTRAFPSPYVLDARRCISYLTIEHRGMIDPDLRRLMQRWVFGCDACQEVCPWVKQYRKPSEQHGWLSFDADRCSPRLEEIMAMDRPGFLTRFAGTPVIRTKLSGLRRNAAIALGNCGQAEAVRILDAYTADEDPVVRDAVAHSLLELKKQGA